MIRVLGSLAAATWLLIGAAAPAHAQQPAPRNETTSPALTDGSPTALSLLTACRRDYRAHCVGTNPSAPVAAGCLAQHYINLSGDCRTALDTYNDQSPASDAGDD